MSIGPFPANGTGARLCRFGSAKSAVNFECIGSVNELKNKPGCSGLKEPLDLHRPFMDDVTFTCENAAVR